MREGKVIGCINKEKVREHVCMQGIESCSGAYGTQSCVECVVYELIKATFQAKQR